MKGDIAIESMVTVLVAIVAAGMLIALAFGRLPELSQRLSCSAYTIMNAIVPTQDGLKPSLPSYCTESRTETPKISKSRNQTVEEIAAYILDCWEQGGRGGMNETFTCNEFAVDTDENFVITPAEVVQIFIDNDLCDERGIMSNSSNCGTKEQINWTRTQINNKDFVLLEYTSGVVIVR